MEVPDARLLVSSRAPFLAVSKYCSLFWPSRGRNLCGVPAGLRAAPEGCLPCQHRRPYRPEWPGRTSASVFACSYLHLLIARLFPLSQSLRGPYVLSASISLRDLGTTHHKVTIAQSPSTPQRAGHASLECPEVIASKRPASTRLRCGRRRWSGHDPFPSPSTGARALPARRRPAGPLARRVPARSPRGLARAAPNTGRVARGSPWASAQGAARRGRRQRLPERGLTDLAACARAPDLTLPICSLSRPSPHTRPHTRRGP